MRRSALILFLASLVFFTGCGAISDFADAGTVSTTTAPAAWVSDYEIICTGDVDRVTTTSEYALDREVYRLGRLDGLTKAFGRPVSLPDHAKVYGEVYNQIRAKNPNVSFDAEGQQYMSFKSCEIEELDNN